jgi:predicted permease
MTQIVVDVRLALRSLLKAPSFTATAVLSLALGIGANTAMFSVIHALLLRPLPYRDANRLVILWNRSPGLNITEDWFSTAQYFDVRSGHSGFEAVAIAIGANYNLSADDREPERVGCIRISSNLLPMLGATTVTGRLFAPDEDVPGLAPTAVLSHGMWTRRYGADPAVIGRTIRLNDQPFEIVGVLAEGFSLPREVLPTLGVAEDGEIFLPLPLSAEARTNRNNEDYNILAKLKPGVSVAAARAEMETITAGLRRDHPDVYPPNGGLTFDVVPLLEQVVGDVRRPLWILLGAVACVLLIACANVASLLMSRALGRQKEFAVRVALGAGRARIVSHILTESLVLALLGGAGGLLLASLAVGAIHVLRPANLPRLSAISIDATALAFTAAIALTTAFLFGLVPALATDRDPSGSLTRTSRSIAGTSLRLRRLELRTMLVAAELALSVVLLVGAGLLIRSFGQLERVPPGFDRRNVLTFELMMTGRQYATPDPVRNAYRRLWEEIDRLPGVTASGGITSLPLSGFFAWGPITIEGRVPPPGERFINADQRTVSGRYFEALGIPLVRGRLFGPDDRADARRVVVVDERMAAEFWPAEDPIGKRIRNGDAASTAPWLTIVGVVGRVKQYALDADSRIAFYTPQSQGLGRALYVVVKTQRDPVALNADVMRAVKSVDPNLPVYRVRTMDDVVERSLSQQRFAMWLLTAFAATALTLALVGIYGVMSYLVSQGLRDFGIRLALGATPRVILRSVLSRACVLTAIGMAAGLAGAAALARVMRRLVFGIGTTDPIAFGSVAVLLAATALVASYLPARRATQVDPIAVLRSE